VHVRRRLEFKPSTAQRERGQSLTVTDVKEFAGTCQGYGRSTYGSGQIAITETVRDDGTYTSVGQSINEGKIQLVDGRLITIQRSQVGLNLEERAGKQMLVFSGTMKRAGQQFTGEYVRTKWYGQRLSL